ncbi:MAG TPA: hypothetical protein VEG34_16950 [Thermoanaerobaculia bacterium]|nr:hypothetical protein [Thermoanaerobaculia bacterium]
MADDAYWTGQSAGLDDPETGAFAFTPMSEAALIAHGPFLTVSDALKFLVLGRPDDAKRLIDDFLPRLIARLHDTEWTRALLKLERTGRLASLTETAHLAYWLTEGSFCPDFARRAYDLLWKAHREFSPKARPDGSQLLPMMLLEIEAEEPMAAKRVYELYESNGVSLPPASLRFSRNPRALLYAHLHRGVVPDGTLDDALKAFRAAATRWERDICPIPFVGLADAARIIWACLSLRGLQPTLQTILPLLR